MDSKLKPGPDNSGGLSTTEHEISSGNTDTPASKPSLREKYALLTILKACPVPSILFANGQFTIFLNPAFVDIFGYTSNDIPTAEVWGDKAAISPANPSNNWSRILKDANGKAVTGLELRLRSKNGDEKQVICSLVPLRLENIDACLAIFVDITAQACAMEALSESSKVLQSIIETIPMRIFWKDRESRFLGCNTVFALDAGMESPQQMIGQTDYDMAWKAQADSYCADDRKTMDTRQAKLGYEEAIRNADGTMEYVRTSKAPLLSQTGEVIGVLGLYEDITEQKRLHQELHLTQVAIDKSNSSFYRLSPEGQVIYVNDFACRCLGYSREELTGKYVWDFDPAFPPEEWPRMWEGLKKDGIVQISTYHQRKDGVVFPVEITGNYIVSDEHEYSFTFVQDVSERRRIERDLQLTHTAINKSQTAFYWLNPQGRVIYANDYACDSLGYSREELTGKYVWDFDPDFKSEAQPAMWEELKRNGQLVMESRHRRADGSIFPVEITANFIAADNEEHSFVFVQDITERRRLAAREQTRNEVLEMIARGAPLEGILERLVRGTEAEDPEKMCSILLLDEQGQHLLNYLAPSLPVFYNDAIHGIEIGPQVGSCGTAAFLGERVIVEDIATHPLWEDYKELAAKAGLGACWSQPILTASKDVIGTFALYHKTPKTPSEIDFDLMEFLATLAGIAIERHHAVEALKLSASVYENCSEGMMVTDIDNNIVAVNPAFTTISGYSLAEVRGQTPAWLGSDRQGSDFYESVWAALNEVGRWQGEVWERRKNGEEYVTWLTINTIHHDNGEPFQRVALFSDITEKKKSEELIWQQANFDPLTYLPNRRMFRDRLEQEVKKVRRSGLSLALFFIDLDRFKEVNDTVGHSGGDQLLQEAARRIAACVRETDTVARLGGDEFTVILTDLADIQCVNRIAETIIDSLAMPFVLDTETIYVTASMGITIYPNDAKEIDELIQNADQAMYVAKEAGKNRFSFFTPGMQVAAYKRLQLTKDLRIALSAGQLELYYQPIIHLPTGKVYKAEALLRWNHPELGWVSPAEFIPLAEESGLIHSIGDWVFRRAALEAQRWRRQYDADFQISINQSPSQFRMPATLDAWLGYLQELHLPGNAVKVEITEGVLLDATANVTAQLLKFRDAGVQVAIDDFGTGYSSLSYLNKLDIDYLKIDQSFTRNLKTGSSDMALSEAIIVMAHKLGLRVIAEGVETEEQRQLLVQAGCDYAQGYLFSRPLPVSAFEQWLDDMMGEKRTMVS
jgi:diguanylate cyclase (GGDEF)-like protein/PAS domain S-box-containing protein